MTTLDELLSRYQYFLIDQFGVLHNGQQPYDGTINALAAIKQNGAQSIIISNSGKRSSINEQRMSSIGFERGNYHAMVTSGETAWHRLREMIRSGEISPNARCYLIANDGDTSPIDGLNLQLTANPGDANIILLSGLHGDKHKIEHYQTLLAPALARHTLCICTNPDKWALVGNTRVFGPGRVAEEYEAKGGPVMWIGKPHKEIYHYCLTQFDGFTEDKQSQVCCIGDSIEHDICGGSNMNLKTTLVRTGIYQHLTDEELHPLYTRYGATPDHVMKSLSL